MKEMEFNYNQIVNNFSKSKKAIENQIKFLSHTINRNSVLLEYIICDYKNLYSDLKIFDNADFDLEFYENWLVNGRY